MGCLVLIGGIVLITVGHPILGIALIVIGLIM